MAQNGMDAIELLKKDHEAVRKLLAELNDTTERAEKRRPELLEKIAHELEIHTTLEEEIFYPAFREESDKEGVTMTHEAKEEHRAVDALVLPDLKKTEPTSLEFSGRAKVLKELVEHHADEEEEEMFPKARELLSKEKLRALGERMAARKQELGG